MGHRPIRTAVFAGDSITEVDRDEDPAGLGYGWVRLVARARPDLAVVNTGVGGSTVADVRRRWTSDVAERNPAIVTIQVGVNDTRNRYVRNQPVSSEAFAEDLRFVVDSASRAGTMVILIEPFLLPISRELGRWREEDLLDKAALTRTVAEATSSVFVGLSDLLSAAAATHGVQAIADDGIHPTALGHSILAKAWLDAAAAL